LEIGSGRCRFPPFGLTERQALYARPLKRAIQRLIENPLAQHLLAADFSEGDTVLVDAENGEIAFTKAKAKKKTAKT
jgi:ATP-dependent Clp protease ATP-binding subunit ClpA